MTEQISTLRAEIKTPLDAIDALNHAYVMTEFLQGALTLKSDDGITIDQGEAEGLYFIFDDIKDRIKKASSLLGIER